MSRRILHDGRLCGLGSASIDQLCLEPIRNSRLDLQLYLPALSSTITGHYRAFDPLGASSKWRGFQEQLHGISLLVR
jgi:hypothetical protein